MQTSPTVSLMQARSFWWVRFGSSALGAKASLDLISFVYEGRYSVAGEDLVLPLRPPALEQLHPPHCSGVGQGDTRASSFA